MAYDVVFYLPTLASAIAEGDCVTSIGGAETQIWLLARGLAQQGRAVAVVVSDIPGGLPGRLDGVDVVVRAPWRAGGGIRGKARELVTLWRAVAPLQSEVIVDAADALDRARVSTSDLAASGQNADLRSSEPNGAEAPRRSATSSPRGRARYSPFL